MIHATRLRRCGALVLQSSESRDEDPDALVHAALEGLRHLGIGALPWTQELRLWQARVGLMREYAVPAPEPSPDLSDEGLAASLQERAPPRIAGIPQRAHFSRMKLGNALRSRLSHAQFSV